MPRGNVHPDGFNRLKPPEGAIESRVRLRIRMYHANRDHRAHHHFTSDALQVAFAFHFALLNASTTAAQKASALSVAPET